MSRSPLKRALGSLRRLIRRRRVPGPSEQEWLRLILLVRRLQRGQLAFVQRLDEIRALTGVLGSFRSDFGLLHEQLEAAHESAGALDRGLAERLGKLDGLPDAEEERRALDQRISALDELVARLERLDGQVPTALQPSGELGSMLARLDTLAVRLESAQQTEHALGGQEELVRLYERIQELAEGLARAPRTAAHEPRPPFDWTAHATAQEERLARLEQLTQRLEGSAAGSGARSTRPEELAPLLARFEGLAERLEQTPAALPELPPETIACDDVAAIPSALELRANQLCEQETRRRLDAELEALRERLRASELARIELETRHSSELAQVADHVGRQLQRVEEDLKKKKRGLAELTQQNIALQGQIALLQGQADAGPAAEPRASLPRRGAALAQLMQAETSADPAAGREAETGAGPARE